MTKEELIQYLRFKLKDMSEKKKAMLESHIYHPEERPYLIGFYDGYEVVARDVLSKLEE